MLLSRIILRKCFGINSKVVLSKRLSICLAFVFVCFHLARGQRDKVDEVIRIDNVIFTLGKTANLTLDSVVKFVNHTYTTQPDKVRAYYAFISQTISYDMQRLDELKVMAGGALEGHFRSGVSQNPEEVFKNKKAVCEGISKLMVYCCRKSGIPCEMVSGYSKLDGEVVTGILHAWNAVKIDSSWQLIDITWSNGYVNHNNVFVRKLSDRYYLTSPAKFIEEHLPMDAMWQLSAKPVTKNYFFNRDSSAGKYYAENFNYNDSISKFLSRPKSEREFYEFFNYHQYDPGNALFQRNLDVCVNNTTGEYLNNASFYYNDFVGFYNHTLQKHPTKANFKKAIALLTSAKTELQSGKTYIKNKKAFTPEFEKEFVTLNENLDKNLTQVNKDLVTIKTLSKQAVK